MICSKSFSPASTERMRTSLRPMSPEAAFLGKRGLACAGGGEMHKPDRLIGRCTGRPSDACTGDGDLR